jgi:hypothetical protein
MTNKLLGTLAVTRSAGLSPSLVVRKDARVAQPSVRGQAGRRSERGSRTQSHSHRQSSLVAALGGQVPDAM